MPDPSGARAPSAADLRATLRKLTPRERFAAVFDAEAPRDPSPPKLTAVVLAYNEGLRLPYFLEHHRRIGVERFIIVDNGSTDGSPELMAAAPDILRLESLKPYKQYKSIWREVIADALLADSWACFPDVDELLIYPGWPGRSLLWFCDGLSRRGYDALFTSMVDMYPQSALGLEPYVPGASFIEYAPLFDVGNYRLSHRRADLERAPTPPMSLQGGPRERLFLDPRRRPPNAVEAWIARRFLSPTQPLEKTAIGRWKRQAALRLVKSTLPKHPPAMGKVPLVKWRPGTEFLGGVHYLSPRYDLAPDWGALLHFKYFDDFFEKAEILAERGQHSNNAHRYKTYRDSRSTLEGATLSFEGTRRFTGVRDLTETGLMRISPDLAAALDAPGNP
ncbi:MAG: glycosyltransferase family 2 protein [Pseudomonadota bacterium]